MTSEQLLKEAKVFREQLVTARRYLHTHPGTEFDIPETLAYVKDELSQMG